MEQCIEKLVKFDPNSVPRPMSVELPHNNNVSDDEADVVIESEEIKHVKTPAKAKMSKSSTSQQNDEATKSPWPSYKQSAGFAAVVSAAPCPNQKAGPILKQPRLMPSALEKHPDIPEVIRHIEQGHRILVCIRGAPGSGKSYLARAIIDRTMHGDYENHIFSTDDHFYDRRTKRYCYDRSKLSQAHDSNQFRVGQRALNGWSPIFVDNTNMKWWEMFPYFKIAVQHNYVIKILEPNTPWRIAVGKLAQRNKHGVDQESIARMLNNYEPGSVDDILRAMQIHNYSTMKPQMRRFPEIQQPKHHNEPSSSRANESGYSRLNPRDQRPRRYDNNREHIEPKPTTSNESNVTKLANISEKWPAFEDEQTSFWNTESNANPKQDKHLPKPQRNPTSSTNIANMYSLLQDKPKPKPTDADTETNASPSSLKRHKKDCASENKSFQEIRRIYPQIPVALLWDLFEKCNGDGNWTMDILLNESETKDMQTLHSQEAIDRDNFTCDCEKPSLSLGLSQAVDAIPAEWLKDSRSQPLPARNQRRQKQSVTSENDVVKHIEQQFVISDTHYSDHSRKIRDMRRSGATASGATATTSSSSLSNTAAKASGSISPDDNINEDDEMIEIDLGIELVCQLDQKFGSNTFNTENLKDIKTKVFMPKSLGQQLYATWIESLYHQIEEQKQQSIKDDEEFAKVLQVKQPQMQTLFEVTQSNSNIQNIADMEYAWKAYNCNANEWKQQSRGDLAMKLTKAKLFEIFPNVDRDQLIDVFIAYGNNFSKTVEFFKESLKSEIDVQMQAKGQELATQARVEAQAVRKLHYSEASNMKTVKNSFFPNFRFNLRCHRIRNRVSTRSRKTEHLTKWKWKMLSVPRSRTLKRIEIWLCIIHI